MAKFINFNIVGGYDQVAGAADSSLDGDNLVAVDSIVNVKAEAAGGGEYNVVLQLNGLAGATSCTVTCATTAEADIPAGNIPTATNYLALMKKAVNRAITANPGGVKSTVSLPQDTVPQGSYDQDKTVYFKSFVVA